MAARSLLERIRAGETIVTPGAFDPLGARLIEHLGFDSVHMGGWVTGAHLAVTEPLLTMTEQVDAARRVATSIQIPLIVDAGAGFGEPLHTRRTVREFENAGAAAVHLEDQHHPKRAHYHKGIEDICDRETFLQKIRVAVEGRRSSEFVIIARTDAAKARNGDLKEAIWRCNAALDAGADVVLPLVTPAVPKLDSTEPEEHLIQIRKGLPEDACVAILSGYLPGQAELSVDDYRDRGYQMLMYPLTPAMAYVGALESMYRPLKEQGKLPATGTIGFAVEDYWKVQQLVEELLQFSELIGVEENTVEAERG